MRFVENLVGDGAIIFEHVCKLGAPKRSCLNAALGANKHLIENQSLARATAMSGKADES